MKDVTIVRGANDFDFLHGDWTVRHERLKSRLIGASDWERFGGTTNVRPILGGAANFDENRIELPSGTYTACTLRLFDTRSGTWSIRWIDGREPQPGAPVLGSFTNGMGSFYGEDQHAGKPILVRFRWSRTNSPSPRWEQAFSADRGATWETNWVMDFHRSSQNFDRRG